MEIAAVVITVIAGISVLGFLVSRSASEEKQQRAEKLAATLREEDPQVAVDPETGTATCRVRGLEVRFRLATRGSGSSAESWTEVEVGVATRPLVLTLRRQQRIDASLLAEGLAVDIRLGNPEVDARYLVEGAPADVVKHLLSPEIQERMLALEVDEVEAGPTALLVARRGWKEEQGDVRAFVAFAVDVAERVGSAVAAAKEAAAPRPESAYRGLAAPPEQLERWKAAQREVAERQAREVADLEQVREQRRAWESRKAMLMLAVILGVVALLVWGSLNR